MDIKKYLEEKKEIEKKILSFINSGDNTEENYQAIINTFNENKNYVNDRFELQSILFLILRISDHHQRTPDFFSKIEKMLLFFKDLIKQTYSNQEVFNFFKKSKRILLFLFKEGIIRFDKKIVDEILNNKDYPYYFFNVIKPFLRTKTKESIEKQMQEIYCVDFEKFEENVKTGENDSYICELIRNDSIDKFIAYVNLKNKNLSSNVDDSIFETNKFLIKRKPNLIEYAAFFGSEQIFKYLYLNGAKLSQSLWLYSVHGQNQEIFQILVDNDVQPEDNTFSQVFKESIKCHDAQVSEYIISNYVKDIDENKLILNSCSIKYSNYLFFPEKLSDSFSFFQLCKYNYYTIVKYLIENVKLDVNKIIVLILLF